MSVKLDRTSEAILIHRYLARVQTTKYAEYYRVRKTGKRFERYQPVLSERTFHQIQWANIWADVKAMFTFRERMPWNLQVARGAVSFDLGTRGSVTPAAASLTFSHTTSSSSGGALIAGVNAVSSTTWTATYAAASLTETILTDGRGDAFSKLTPATGANNAVFTPGANRVIVGMVMTFTGASAISDFAKADDTGASVTSTSFTCSNFRAGDMIGEMLLIYADDPTASSAGADQTVRIAFSQQPPADVNATVTAASTNATNGTCTWSWTTARACSSFGFRINSASGHNLTLLGVGT